MYCGIRVRLLCAVLTPAAAIALMLLIFLANARLERLGEELEDQARLIANEWAPAIEQALVRDDRKTLLNIVQAAIQDRHIEQIRICDRQGQVLAEAKEPPRSSGLFTLANHLLDQLPASVHQQQPAAVLPLHVGSYNADPPHLLAPTNTFGTLEIGMSVAAATHEDLAALVLPGLLALAALFCAGLFALLIAETLRRPIRSLTHQVQQIEHDRPGGMTLTGVRGELGHLEAAMETMAQALRQRQYLLQEQVRRTTSELRQTLRALEVQNAELDVARKRALEASQTKSQFLANVSHEIRTPINGIVGFTELLSYSPLDAEQRDHVDTIKASCANLLAIINDILDFSKI
ncbi:MAG TPA: histidine kinase dimerization/phospho-acceptor domain-containing protein, partial [Nitrococcus sp.]|nr:histidine kinase dimerization/phospho-acceptor domain-containing protein [Nitrococcus sp.]